MTTVCKQIDDILLLQGFVILWKFLFEIRGLQRPRPHETLNMFFIYVQLTLVSIGGRCPNVFLGLSLNDRTILFHSDLIGQDSLSRIRPGSRQAY